MVSIHVVREGAAGFSNVKNTANITLELVNKIHRLVVILYGRHQHYEASFSKPYIASPTSQLILQPLRCFTYVTAHSTVLPLLHLHHRHFTYVAVILQCFCCYIYATAHSTSLPSLHLRHRPFYNPSVASPTSQALHVLHLASRPCIEG